jgi:hypothetical protein
METWNTDRWHRRLQQDGSRERLKIALDGITTVFHNLLHDIPCGMPENMPGLEEILTGGEGSRREKIRKEIGNGNRMVAFVQLLMVGPYVEVSFYEVNKKKCHFVISYEKDGRFHCLF